MATEPGVMGLFEDPQRAAAAIREIRAAGFGDVRASAPAHFPALALALGRPRSGLDRVTLAAAGVGTLAGFALCIGTSLSWRLVTGGKPIVSLPPFVVIAFELAVLVGALVNLAALVLFASRGRRRRDLPDMGGATTIDHIGVFVLGADTARAESILRAGGAQEVRRVP